MTWFIISVLWLHEPLRRVLNILPLKTTTRAAYTHTNGR